MGKAAYFFTLCFTSLAVFIFIYWAIGWLLFYKTGNLKEVRMLAASQLSETLENNLPEECLNMGLKADQIKNCSFETKKHIKGEETITVKSTIQVEEKKGTQVGIKIQHEIKDGPDYLTEAGFCGTDQCSKFKTTEVDKLSETIWSMLNEADSQINKAANENYHAIKKQEELEERITNCEISKDSTIDKIVELTQAKEQKCQINDLIAQLTQQKPEEKTLSFHYDVKERLWNIVAQNRPNQDFFLQEYVKKLQAPGFFDHQQFSIQSSFSLMEKYQEFRLFMGPFE